MAKNPIFTLVLGLLVGLVIGYVIAEKGQQVKPASAAVAADSPAGLPSGHPPVAAGANMAGGEEQLLARQVADLEAKVAANPTDVRPLVMLGNLHFDAGNWQASRLWYERSLKLVPDDPDVITDLAVVYRRLSQPERALELLDLAIGIDPQHVISRYNKAVILHYDLHRHDEAVAALEQLKGLDLSRSGLDITALEQDVLGAGKGE